MWENAKCLMTRHCWVNEWASWTRYEVRYKNSIRRYGEKVKECPKFRRMIEISVSAKASYLQTLRSSIIARFYSAERSYMRSLHHDHKYLPALCRIYGRLSKASPEEESGELKGKNCRWTWDANHDEWPLCRSISSVVPRWWDLLSRLRALSMPRLGMSMYREWIGIESWKKLRCNNRSAVWITLLDWLTTTFSRWS